MLSLTDRVKHEELSQTVTDRNILHTMKRRKANWHGLILHGNYLLIHVAGGKLEQMGRGGSRHHQTLDDFKRKTRRTRS